MSIEAEVKAMIASVTGLNPDQIDVRKARQYVEDINGDPFYERVRLIDIFERRISFTEDQAQLKEMTKFVSKLKELSNEEPLFSWIFKDDDYYQGGWSTSNEVILNQKTKTT